VFCVKGSLTMNLPSNKHEYFLFNFKIYWFLVFCKYILINVTKGRKGFLSYFHSFYKKNIHVHNVGWNWISIFFVYFTTLAPRLGYEWLTIWTLLIFDHFLNNWPLVVSTYHKWVKSLLFYPLLNAIWHPLPHNPKKFLFLSQESWLEFFP
jgi:hypothetical protein